MIVHLLNWTLGIGQNENVIYKQYSREAVTSWVKCLVGFLKHSIDVLGMSMIKLQGEFTKFIGYTILTVLRTGFN